MNIRKRLYTAAVLGAFVASSSFVQGETLQEAVEKMITTNPEVQSSVFNTLGRKEEVKQARSGYYPTLDFSAGYGVQEIQEPVDESLDPRVYTLSLRQNLFRGFADVNEVDRQKARVRSQAYRVHGTSDQIALRTSEVYLNVLRQEELLRLAEENLETHLRIADQIKLRSDSGVSSTSDSDQVDGRVALARANVVVARTNLADAESNYLAVVGNFPESLVRPEVPQDTIPATLEEAEQIAIEQHPILRTADEDLAARHKQHEVAAAPYWPDLDLEVDQNWEEDFDEPGSDDNLIVMLRLRYNLFNGLKDNARRAETAHLVSEAREIRNNTQRQVVESIRLSWMAYKAVVDRQNYLMDRVKSTEKTANSYAKQFNFGKRTLLDVLDTEAEVIDAKQDMVDAEYDGLYSQYRIINGLGKLVTSLGVQLPEEALVDEEG